jgi:hypothetical protein
MTRVVMLCALLTGCSSESEVARSELQVTLGMNAPTQVAVDVMTGMESSRFMIRATDGHVGVIVSLATPVTARQINIESDTEIASVWGQLDANPPLLTRSGTLTVVKSGSTFDLDFANIAKVKDAAGESVLITGSITGVSVP